MPITIYGIKNCDTMKKARAWLDDHGVAYGFHDYKLAGIAKDKLRQWSDEVGWETLLGGKLLVGFKPDIYASEVASKPRGRKA